MTATNPSTAPAMPASISPRGLPRPAHDESGLLRIPNPSAAPLSPIAGLRGATAGQFRTGAPLLAPGARIGILCDTLHGDPEIGLDYASALSSASELIRSLGYEPVVDTVHAAVSPYCIRWAGDVPSRAEHFVRLLRDQRVDAVFPLFGKGGGHDVISAVVNSGFRPERPVVLIGGFSHHTDWSLFALSPQGQRFFSHVLSATQAAYWKMLPQENVANLKAMLSGATQVRYTGLSPVNRAAAEMSCALSGPLAGGNMGAVVLSAGRSWMPSFAGTIALCEDYDRHPHDVHRSFMAFSERVVDDGAKAIVIGSMLPLKKAAHQKLEPDARKAAAAADRTEIMDTVQEVASHLSIPVFHHPGLFGHGALNCPVALGGDTEIVMGEDGLAELHNTLRMSTRFNQWGV